MVSIGLPVYNGQNYLSEAIESALSQSYENLELVISDNASNDATESICRSFVDRDKRIKYYRFDKNYGASKNYNRTFELSDGKYFKWLAHDDLLMPENIKKSVDVLEADPDVVICSCAKLHINGEGKVFDDDARTGYGHNDLGYKKLKIDWDSPIERYKSFMKHFSASFANADFIMGLMRSDVLKKTNLIGNFSSSDFILLGELVLNGKFQVIDDQLFKRRIHHGVSTSVYNNRPDLIKELNGSGDGIQLKSHAELGKWFDPDAKVRRIPHFKWLRELLRNSSKFNWSLLDRVKITFYSYRWFVAKVLHALNLKVKNIFAQ